MFKPGRCLIIGEVAQAHDGSLGTAHAYIDAIADAGLTPSNFKRTMPTTRAAQMSRSGSVSLPKMPTGATTGSVSNLRRNNGGDWPSIAEGAASFS